MTEHNPTQLDTQDTAPQTPDPNHPSFVDNGVEDLDPSEAERDAEDPAGASAEAEQPAEDAAADSSFEAEQPAEDAVGDSASAHTAPQTPSGRVPTEFGEVNPPESASKAPQTGPEPAAHASGDSNSGSAEVEGGVLGDEDHLPPGQTEVPVGEEVVIDDETMRRALEAILMVTDEPLPVLTLARVVGRPTGDVSAALTTLAEEYTEQGRGFDLREVGGGWRYYTRVEAAPYVERFVLDGQQARLTQAALETLAVVAYKQPVSRARVSAIRGVNVDGVMRTLIARGLVEEAGADTESQATLYRTTSYFLERMGMQSLDDLPELAPYLPEMDDVEDELAAQTIPSAAPTEETAPEESSAAEPPRSESAVEAEDSRAEDAGDDMGIDGDLSTDEPVDLDLEHEPGEVEPSDEVEPSGEVGPAEAEAEAVERGDAIESTEAGTDADLVDVADEVEQDTEPVDEGSAAEVEQGDELADEDSAEPSADETSVGESEFGSYGDSRRDG